MRVAEACLLRPKAFLRHRAPGFWCQFSATQIKHGESVHLKDFKPRLGLWLLNKSKRTRPANPGQHLSFILRLRNQRLHLLDATLNDLKFANHRGATASAASRLKLQRFVCFKASEQISERHLEGISDADERREAKILTAGFEVPDKRPVHLEVVGERLLGSKATLHPDIAYPLPKAPKYLFHHQSVKDGLSNVLPLDR
jgi:hypothetical protein